jgi:hypothetical protein
VIRPRHAIDRFQRGDNYLISVSQHIDELEAGSFDQVNPSCNRHAVLDPIGLAGAQ